MNDSRIIYIINNSEAILQEFESYMDNVFGLSETMNNMVDGVIYVDVKDIVMQPGTENDINQESTKLNIDKVLNLCGSFGYYQILVNIAMFLVALVVLVLIFFAIFCD